jgi:hypothetical protein
MSRRKGKLDLNIHCKNAFRTKKLENVGKLAVNCPKELTVPKSIDTAANE